MSSGMNCSTEPSANSRFHASSERNTYLRGHRITLNHPDIFLVLQQKRQRVNRNLRLSRWHTDRHCSPARRNTLDTLLNNLEHTSTIDCKSRATSPFAHLLDVFHHITDVLRINYIRRPQLLRQIKLEVQQINGHNLLNTKILSRHQRRQPNPSHAKNRNTILLLRLQHIQYRARARLKSTSHSRIYTHTLGVIALHHTPLLNYRMLRKTRVSKVLTSHTRPILETRRRRSIFQANRVMVDKRVIVAERWVIRDALGAFPADVEGEEDVVTYLKGFVFYAGADAEDSTGAFVAEDGGEVDQGEETLLEDDVLVAQCFSV